jgi:hypothetical protein
LFCRIAAGKKERAKYFEKYFARFFYGGTEKTGDVLSPRRSWFCQHEISFIWKNYGPFGG